MPSSLHGVEAGVFAYKLIYDAKVICSYSGTRHGRPPEGENAVFEAIRGVLWINGDTSISYGPSINHCSNENRVNCKIIFLPHTNKAVVIASRDITPGEELFLFYGFHYWSQFPGRLAADDEDDLQRRFTTSRQGRIQSNHPSTPSSSDSFFLSPLESSSTLPKKNGKTHSSVPIFSDCLSNDSDDFDLDYQTETAQDDDPDIHTSSKTLLTADLTLDEREQAWIDDAGLTDLADWIKSAFPESPVSLTQITSLLSDAFKLGSSIYREDAANEWAEHFNIPAVAIQADLDLLHACGGDFNKLIREKRSAIDSDRMSAASVKRWISPNNPEYHKMIDLALNGIDLCTPPSYEGVTFDTRPHLGRAFLATACAVEKMMFEAYWSRGLAIVLPATEVQRLATFGMCIAGWATKLNKKSGRPITNGSGRPRMSEAHFINGPATKAIAILKYGNITNPTIGDAIRMILKFLTDNNCTIDDVTVFKFDLKAAYTMLSYALSQVREVGVELRDEVFMFFLGGVFGLTSTPFAFDVVTRALVWELNILLKGSVLMYVDDGLIVTLHLHEEHDIDKVCEVATGLLGSDAVAMDKLIRAIFTLRNMDFIGYNLCLLTQVVSIAHHNLLKALYSFSSADTSLDACITVKMLQRLASLASRYGGICRLMRPFVRVLYAAYTGRRTTSVRLDSLTRRVITFFKTLFILISHYPTKYATPFSNFTFAPALWVCEFDASLTGIGIIWLKKTPDGREAAVAYTSIDITSLGFRGLPKYQNTAEYLASLFCVLGLAQLGHAESPCHFLGDSLSALTWIDKGSVRSDSAIKAAMIWAQAVVHLHVQCTGTTHIDGESNYRTDCLSRHGSWSEVIHLEQKHNDGRLTLPHTLNKLDLNPDPVLRLCGSDTSITSPDAFVRFLQHSRDIVLAHSSKTTA